MTDRPRAFTQISYGWWDYPGVDCAMGTDYTAVTMVDHEGNATIVWTDRIERQLGIEKPFPTVESLIEEARRLQDIATGE